MVAETWLYNPWVVAIGSGILLILFEEIISAYKEKKYTIGHVGNEQRFVAFCFIKLIFYLFFYEVAYPSSKCYWYNSYNKNTHKDGPEKYD